MFEIECLDCERMFRPVDDEEDIYCPDCAEKRAERSWNRFVEDFYGGSGPLPLSEQQIAARKLK